MARDFTKNTANYINLGTAAINPLISGATAVSLHAWINFDSTTTATNDNRIFNPQIHGTSAGVFLAINGVASLNSVRFGARSVSTDGAQLRNGTTGLAAGVWHSIGGVADFTGDIVTPYQNGSADNGGAATFGNNTYTTGTPTTGDVISGDVIPPSATTVQFDGRIAEIALWNVDIGASAFTTLSQGYSALLVRRDALVFYLPMFGANKPETPLVSSVVPVIVGTVNKATHPDMLKYPGDLSIKNNLRPRAFAPGLAR